MMDNLWISVVFLHLRFSELTLLPHIYSSSVAYSEMFSSNSSVYDKGLVSESICKSIVLVLSIGLSESTKFWRAKKNLSHTEKVIKQLKRKRTGKPDSYNNLTVKQATSKTVYHMLNTQLPFTFTTLELARQYLQNTHCKYSSIQKDFGFTCQLYLKYLKKYA